MQAAKTFRYDRIFCAVFCCGVTLSGRISSRNISAVAAHTDWRRRGGACVHDRGWRDESSTQHRADAETEQNAADDRSGIVVVSAAPVRAAAVPLARLSVAVTMILMLCQDRCGSIEASSAAKASRLKERVDNRNLISGLLSCLKRKWMPVEAGICSGCLQP